MMDDEKKNPYDIFPDMNFDGKHDVLDMMIFEEMVEDERKRGIDNGFDPILYRRGKKEETDDYDPFGLNDPDEDDDDNDNDDDDWSSIV